MSLSWNEIKARAVVFAHAWADEKNERAESQSFWNEFFEMFGLQRRKVASFEQYIRDAQAGESGFIDLLWKGTLLIEQKSRAKSASAKAQTFKRAYSQAINYFPGLKDHELPRYVLVCDFWHFELHDLEPAHSTVPLVHSFTLDQLPDHIHLFDFFLYGKRDRLIRESDPINRQAVEAIGDLHDALKANGYAGAPLEVFLVRLLFCFFADDTGIFQPKDSFHDLLAYQTREDGSDMGSVLQTMFETLNVCTQQRQKNLAEHFANFPYINGKLFADHHPTPQFDAALRGQLLALCGLNWGAISPAIFGAMFQTVIELEATNRRRQLGAHYTSEANILKVIGPLFLDDLRAELGTIKTNKNALFEFHKKLRTLTFLDPACGCGNFLVIAYRELRMLELEVLKAAAKFGARTASVFDLLQVNVDQFYGIEIEEFPAQIAQVAMWLTDHQMNQITGLTFGEHILRIPLEKSAQIRRGNALEIDWSEFVPPQQLSFIMGNPPFIGKHYQTPDQKRALSAVTVGMKRAGVLDFVAGWYVKAAQYMCAAPDNFKGIALKANVWRKRYEDVQFGQSSGVGNLFASEEALEVKNRRAVKCAFVSTNSITQGEQVAVLWGELQAQGLHIQFAHRTFQWTNEAPGKAAVHCVVIGFGMDSPAQPVIYDYPDVKGEPVAMRVQAINPYLSDAESVFISARSQPICSVPEMGNGGKPTDGGHLLLSDEERRELIKQDPNCKPWIRPFVMGEEFINGLSRWCLWLKDVSPNEIRASEPVQRRVELVKKMRLSSTKAATRELAKSPSLFGELRQPQTKRYLAIPKVSSQNRAFIPIGFLDAKTICGDKIFFVEDATLFHFGVLTSTMHMAWVRHTAGRLKSDFSYSNSLVYNNFPWPMSGHAQCKVQAPDTYARIEQAAQKILDERARWGKETTLATLYDPLITPAGLLAAHKELDIAVDRAYEACGGARKYQDDAKRVAFLFTLYERYTSLL